MPPKLGTADPRTRATAFRKGLVEQGNSGFTMSNSGRLFAVSIVLIIGVLSYVGNPKMSPQRTACLDLFGLYS